MIFRFEIVAAVICAICAWILMLSAPEVDKLPLMRKFLRLAFPKLDFMQRHRRLNLIVGVLLAVFGVGAVIAFVINRWGTRI